MKRTVSTTCVLLLLVSAACSIDGAADPSGRPLADEPAADPPETVTGTALLELRGASEVLTLDESPADTSYHRDYPNPKRHARMSVDVDISGAINANCTDVEGKVVTCLDTPFLTKVEHAVDGVVVHVHDLYGVECAKKRFPKGERHGTAGATEYGGTPAPSSDACVSTREGQAAGPKAPACTDDGAAKTRDEYCAAINGWLKRHSMSKIDCGALDGPGYDKMPNAKKKADGACDDIWGDPWIKIVMRWTKGCECYAERTVRWNNVVRALLIKEGACAHSPLVLDLAGDGIHLGDLEGGVDFDLMASGQRALVAWPQGDDAFLALDRNGNGRIDDGSELFGQSSAGAGHSDGFSALAELDANGDGLVDARDPAFAELVVWRDANHDGVSSPDEISPLVASGIRSLEVLPSHVTGDAVFDAHANRIPLLASFQRADGSRGRMVDAFLRYRPR